MLCRLDVQMQFRKLLSLYVDDMIIFCYVHDGIWSLKRELANRFAMKVVFLGD